MDKHERQIARRLALGAIEAGYSVSVFDGEETTLHKSTDIKAIVDALGSTDCDALRFYSGPTYVGAAVLIWGNGEDLISDWSENISEMPFFLAALEYANHHGS